MALTEEHVLSQVCVDEWGHISVRYADRVFRDGMMISETYDRHVLTKGDDISKEHAIVKAMAQALWNPLIHWPEPPVGPMANAPVAPP